LLALGIWTDRPRPPDTGPQPRYLAASGALALAGHWSEPRRSGLPVANLAGGCYAAIAILAALHERQGTGRGAYLDLHDVPAQRRLTPAEAVRSPQSVARETVLELNGERHIPFPVLVDGRRGGVLGNTAPAPGADAQSILGELGLTPAEIAALRRSGLIGNQAQSQDASI
jgi:crotonobetainyl-CoA:carnitine CoA-transferase CaiB-like acyl-CoA transferase